MSIITDALFLYHVQQESSGLPNKIQITSIVVSKLQSKGYDIVPRGYVTVKVSGFGKISMVQLSSNWKNIHIISINVREYFYIQQGKGEMQTYWLEKGPHERGDDEHEMYSH